jgi:hypothetical protein
MEATLCDECGVIHKIGEDNTLCPTHPDYKEPSGPLFKECPIGCDQGFLPDAVQAWDCGGPEPECSYCSLKEKANALHKALVNVLLAIDGWPTPNFKEEAKKALDNYRG